MQVICPRDLHTYQFTVLNGDERMPTRTVQSLLSPDEISAVASVGYCFVSRLLSEDHLQRFRECVDRVKTLVCGNDQSDTYRSGRYGGQYLRDLHAHDAEAWPLLTSTPIIDTVRSLLGPRIVLRSYSARITFPASHASTIWHADQRNDITPRAPWFTPTQSTTVLIYLDKADSRSGQTSLVPDSHRRSDVPHEYEPPDDAVTLDAEAGDILVFNGSLWHRAGQNTGSGDLRRVLNVQFAPSWCKVSAFKPDTDHGLIEALAADARARGRSDILELLGFGGYM